MKYQNSKMHVSKLAQYVKIWWVYARKYIKQYVNFGEHPIKYVSFKEHSVQQKLQLST